MSKKHVDITVVVVTYNRAALLRQALETLVSQATQGKFSFEVLVVDDGSTDNTAAVVAEVARQVKQVPVRYVHKQGGGEGDARNRGVKEARGQWLAFCDDDQLAGPGWLAELYSVAQEQGAHCVGGSVALLAPDSGRIRLGARTRRFLGEKWLPPNLNSPAAKNSLGAGNLLVHRSVFDKVGGFDITLRQGVDTDFFWRLERAGFSLTSAPKALVYHVMPESRLQPAYLRQVCLRKGVATHRIRVKYQGQVKAAGSLLLRLAIALTVDLPLLLLGVISHDSTLVLGSRCRLWYKLGFIREGLFALAPNVFRQTKFFQELDSGYHGAKRESPSCSTYPTKSTTDD